MKVSWNKLPTKVISELLQDVKATAPKVLEAFSKEVEVSARKNFNRAVNDISGGNPYITVVRTVSGLNAKITCMGEQVLFAEFGAGIFNSYAEKYIESHFAISRANVLYYVQGHYRTIAFTTRGFTNGGMTETMPRPAGIYPLGQYEGRGKETWGQLFGTYVNMRKNQGYSSQGINEYWVRPSQNGRMANRESRVHKPNGEVREGVVWTMGTKPVRGLYRARNTAINKLQSGRLNIK